MLLNRGEKGEGLSVYVWILSAWIPLVVLFYYSLGHWYYCSGWRGSRVPAHRRECRVTCEISLHRKPVCFFSLYLHFKSSFHNLSSLSPPIAMRKVGGSISWRSVTAIWNLLSETVDIRQLAAQEWKWNEWWRIREKERETCDKLKVSDRITGRKNPDVASTCFFGWKTTLAQGSWKKDLRATPLLLLGSIFEQIKHLGQVYKSSYLWPFNQDFVLSFFFLPFNPTSLPSLQSDQWTSVHRVRYQNFALASSSGK